MDIHLTDHLKVRMQQRGYRLADISLAFEIGTPNRDGVFVSATDVENAISQKKGEIQRLERLRDTLIPVDGGTALSIYKAGRKKQRSFRR